MQFVKHYTGAISLSFAVIVTTTATAELTRREYASERRSGVFVMGWLRAWQICTARKYHGKRAALPISLLVPYYTNATIPRQLCSNSSRCESFSFRRIGAITSDFTPQHWVMNAGRVAPFYLRAHCLDAACVLYLSAHHDYIILRAIRLLVTLSIECLKGSKPTICKHNISRVSKNKKNET